MIQITKCPSCGSANIQRVQKDFTDQFQGHVYTVPALEFYECGDCGEKLYDRDAMRKIEAYSPAFTNKHLKRRGRMRKSRPKLVEIG